MNNAVFPILVPAFVEYEQRISSIDFWDPVKFEVAYAARTRYSNQWIRDPVSICRCRLYTVNSKSTIRRNLKLMYDGKEIYIMIKFTYFGVVFTTGGSFHATYEALSGQAFKAVFKL